MTQRLMPPTYDRALLMIQDRIAGVYDAPDLVAWGPLGDCADDVREMVEALPTVSRQPYEAPELTPIPPEEVPPQAQKAFERGKRAYEVRAANGASATMRVEGGDAVFSSQVTVGSGEPTPDPVEALGLADPGDVFERPGKALRRILSEFVPLHRDQVEAGDWDKAALSFAGHLGHGARPEPTDLPMDGTQASYRQLLEQALRVIDEAAGFDERDRTLVEAHERLSGLMVCADQLEGKMAGTITFGSDVLARVTTVESVVAPSPAEAADGEDPMSEVWTRLRRLEDRVALLTRAEARRLETPAPEAAS